VVRPERSWTLLEVAVEGAVDVVVSGDKHLLELAAFEGIPILTAAAFLALLDG
jgi:predicted nucleic acid-binding protein